VKFRGRLRHISSMSTLTGDELNEMEVCCPAAVNTDPVSDSEAWTSVTMKVTGCINVAC